jgi:hypothetical protein
VCRNAAGFRHARVISRTWRYVTWSEERCEAEHGPAHETFDREVQPERQSRFLRRPCPLLGNNVGPALSLEQHLRADVAVGIGPAAAAMDTARGTPRLSGRSSSAARSVSAARRLACPRPSWRAGQR